MTLLVSTDGVGPVLHDMILWYAQNQNDDGSLPASPLAGGELVLFDYMAYWVEDLYDYVLYTGDLSLAQTVWPELEKLLDAWYPAQAGPGGLLVNNLGTGDYAGIPRTGTTVAYFNAGYARALRFAAQIAGWLGETAEAASWTARIAPLAAAFSSAFWDPAAGAFRDSTTGPVVHPQDGNVFAVLAGLATAGQARSALAYLAAHDRQPYGPTIADDNVWDTPSWGEEADMHAYPFITYFELLARFGIGDDATALGDIRSEWGYMLGNGNQTMWEAIGPYGGPPPNSYPSYDHGWSSGAAPALTSFVLGITPATPGFASYRAAPHLSGLQFARGTVPTPHGVIRFSWSLARGKLKATVASPVSGTVVLPAAGPTTVDGKKVAAQRGSTTVKLASGTHTVVVAVSVAQR
jgi:hypothetical protein